MNTFGPHSFLGQLDLPHLVHRNGSQVFLDLRNICIPELLSFSILFLCEDYRVLHANFIFEVRLVQCVGALSEFFLDIESLVWNGHGLVLFQICSIHILRFRRKLL